MNINDSTYETLKEYYDNVLNLDKSSYTCSNDEPTPIDCIVDMIDKIPEELWSRANLSILDPCCGNGNFALPLFFKLIQHHSREDILQNILEFNDINNSRLDNVRQIYCDTYYELNITNRDFLTHQYTTTYDLVIANPPFAKFMENGKRASKNHNLIKQFVEKALSILKPCGYLVYITPDSWMSFADRNTLIEKLTQLQIIHLDIHSAKRYFKKIGSSFTWYIVQNCKSYKPINISGVWKNQSYESSVVSCQRKYIPLLYNEMIYSILLKTLDGDLPKFKVQTSSDLHRYTKAKFINNQATNVYKYRLVHTPKQTVYASRPHKFQDGYKVFISTTDKYKVFVDNCGMTQSIAFILCNNETEAKTCAKILQHPLYVALNNICRWGNFNNVRILQSFPIPQTDDVYTSFGLTADERNYIENI